MPLLIVGLVLLLVVAGLALWQRMQQVEPAGGRPVARPAAVSEPSSPTGEPFDGDPPLISVTDPVIGAITFDDGLWTTDEDVPFGDTTVIVEVTGSADGITDAQRDIVGAALTGAHDLDRRARALINQELARQGIGESEMDTYELALRPDANGRETAYLWYDVEESDREMGVSSTDRWRTLKLEILD
jgi:hypothetical protein